MQLENIPAELRALPQWCVCGANKIPINPRTMLAAEANNPETWATFDECTAALTDGFSHVGFMFAENQPYAILDFDNKWTKPAPAEDISRMVAIIEASGSYAERSTSGRGSHLVMRGTIPRTVTRGHFELYTYPHFIIFTGDTIHTPPRPIVDNAEVLTRLFDDLAQYQFTPAQIDMADEALALRSDAELIDMAAAAANAEKWRLLTQDADSWATAYASQSDADFALMGMLTFYSQSNAQCRRVFLSLPLGHRSKASRDDYIPRMIAKQRARQEANAPKIDMDALRASVAAWQQPEPDNVQTLLADDVPESVSDEYKPISFPAGLLGDIADYILRSSARAVPEVALVAAMALLAGIAGRAYNTSTGTGLNLYLILLGRTGIGKEAAASGIDRVLNATRPRVPGILGFRGPGQFASGQGFLRVLTQHKCFVSVLGEVGFFLADLTNRRANPAMRLLCAVMLDVFGKSGAHQTLYASAYADVANNIPPVGSPAVTLLGESVPEKFFEAMTPEHIASGLVPRFIVVETKAKRTPLNEALDIEVPESIIDGVANLASIAMLAEQNGSHYAVPCEPAAQSILRRFGRECDERVNSSNHVEAEIWNRSHLHALRVSALLAVSRDPRNPLVATYDAEWSVAFVERCAFGLAAHYSGEDDSARPDEHIAVKAAVLAFLAMTPQKRLNMRAPKSIANSRDAVIPHAYLVQAVARRMPCVKAADPTRAALAAVGAALQADLIERMPAGQASALYGSKGAPVYVPGPLIMDR